MSKNLKVIITISLLLLMGSCTPGKDAENSIKLSDLVCTFAGTENQPKTITVVSDPSEWKAVCDDSWLKITEEKGSQLTFTVDDNIDGAERRAEIVVTAGTAEAIISVIQLSVSSDIKRFREYPEFAMQTVISPSGKYLGGFFSVDDGENGYIQHPVIINIETEERIELGVFPSKIHQIYRPVAISDQGTIIFDTSADNQVAFEPDGTNYKIENPAGFKNPTKMQCVNAAGSKIVGYSSRAGMLYIPVIWEDGVARELPMPEKNFRGREFVNGIMARGISANGEIIYGSTWCGQDFGMVYWDKNGEVHYVGEDVRKVKEVVDGYQLVDGMITEGQTYKASPNGKWLAGTFRTENIVEDDKGKPKLAVDYFAAFFNTETEKTYIFKDFGTTKGMAVSDEGIGFFGIGSSLITKGRAVDIEKGIDLGTAKEYLENAYGIVTKDGYVKYVCAGSEVLLGVSLKETILIPEDLYWIIAPPMEQ